MLVAFVVSAVGFLVYANGANDNVKGVASLFGSGTTSHFALPAHRAFWFEWFSAFPDTDLAK